MVFFFFLSPTMVRIRTFSFFLIKKDYTHVYKRLFLLIPHIHPRVLSEYAFLIFFYIIFFSTMHVDQQNFPFNHLQSSKWSNLTINKSRVLVEGEIYKLPCFLQESRACVLSRQYFLLRASLLVHTKNHTSSWVKKKLQYI